MAISKKQVYAKLEFYSRELTKVKPNIQTIQSKFRVYYDGMRLIGKVFYHISENPWHPDNDYANDIFEGIDECFEELEELKKKSDKIDNE